MKSLQLRGNASAEEVAAVLAALSVRAGMPRERDSLPRDPYARWRAARLAALHR